jgi:polyhydroxyalkanoate synthesis regulator phasin
MEPIQTIDLTEDRVWREDEIMTNEFGDLEEAYKLEADIKILKKRINALEERRSEVIETAIEAGNLSQEDAMGNRYELKDKGRTVRTLDVNRLWENHPDAFREIVKNAQWKVDPFEAMEALTEAEILECSVFSPEVMGQKFPDIFMRIAKPSGGSALVGDAQKVLGEQQIDACSEVKSYPRWVLEYVLKERESLGKKARTVKEVQ